MPKGKMNFDGFPIVNAKRRKLITITEKDVARSTRKAAGDCAAAKACCRLPGIQAARVHISTTYLFNGVHWMRYRTPMIVGREIVAFDRDGRFSPGEYYLSPIQPSHQARGERQGTAGKSGRASQHGKYKKNRVYLDIRKSPHFSFS
jgi:hypothetical protein